MVPFWESSPHHWPIRPNVSLRFSSGSDSQKPVSSAISMTYFMSSSLWPHWALFFIYDEWRGPEIDTLPAFTTSPSAACGGGRGGALQWRRRMNLVDVAIVVVIGLGILIGWRKGLIGPLLAEGTFLLSYWIVSTHPGLAAVVPSSVPRPLAVLILPIALGLVVGFAGRMVFMSFFRLPLTRSLDKILGAAANGGLGFVIVYVVLVGLAGAGTVLDPLTKVSSVQPTQVAAMQMLLAENPQVAGFVPSGELGQLATVAGTHPIGLAQLGQYAQVINYYERTLRPALATSQLAPIVLKYGARLPIIGRHVTLPPPR